MKPLGSWPSLWNESDAFLSVKLQVTTLIDQQKPISLLVGGVNPVEKILVKLDHFPNFRVENKKYLSCHHLPISIFVEGNFGHQSTNKKKNKRLLTSTKAPLRWPGKVDSPDLGSRAANFSGS